MPHLYLYNRLNTKPFRFVLQYMLTEFKLLHIFQQRSNNSFTVHELGFTFLDKFSAESHAFQYMPYFVPYNFCSKTGIKKRVILKISMIVERHRKLSTELLWNYFQHALVKYVWSFKF